MQIHILITMRCCQKLERKYLVTTADIDIIR